MRTFIIGLVVGIFAFVGASTANAQVTWVYPQNYPSVCSDANGFTQWLNSVRSTYGLPPVGYDASLEADCHQNNLWQAARGMGHHFFGRARRQNASAVPDFGKVGPCWMDSPGHRAAMLDPNIRFIAITYYAGYTTFSAY